MAKQKKSQPAIEIKNIVKGFLIPKYQNDSLKQTIVHGFKRNDKKLRRVLDGVSFTVNKGDFFGIVGRNGSGKSTLLKMICGIYTPTSGEIITHGQITPFIELGVGFNPELSGRDNVYLNGALLGFDRKEMDQMYNEIVEFAELEEFMDLKLKNFSSGMQVRLAFSIAIKSKSPILVFDEVLAVGDEAFQRKCLDVFEEYKTKDRTVILVTHDMKTVKEFCNRAVLIQDGKIVKNDSPIKIADMYTELNQLAIDQSSRTKNNKNGSDLKVSITDSRGKERLSFSVGEKLSMTIDWDNCEAEVVMVDLYKNSGEMVTNFISKREGMTTLPSNKSVKLDFTALITPGGYHVDIALWDFDMKRRYLIKHQALNFSIREDFSRIGQTFGGLTFLERAWRE